MGNWLSKNLNKIIIGCFLIPILLVAFVSISHVTTFYTLANPFSWAIYLSIAVEIAALAALAGISAKFGKFIYIPFGIVTFIQLLGNFFFSYTWINPNSQDFKDWMDMIAPLLEPLGIEATDATSHRRILGFFTGGLLPFISLTFAHMLIVYSNKLKENDETNQTIDNEKEVTEEDIEIISKEIGKKEKEVSEKYQPYSPSEDDLQKLKEIFEKNYNSEVKPEPTPEPTPEPLYFVDDEPIVEQEQEPINRLVYKKDE